MPHTNRKKNPPKTKSKPHIVHTKRQQIEDSDGWTHVVDAPRRSTPARGKRLLHIGDFEKNGVSYIDRTLEEMHKDFEYYTKQWESNKACHDLKRELGEKEGEKKVVNVIVLGLGSLQSARRDGRRASFTQLAALRTVVEILGNEKAETIFQDPQFTDLDTQFLNSLGYAVVEDPEAISKINIDSLVYAIHCYADVYQAVSEGPRPSVMIITDVANFGRFNLSEKMSVVSKSLEDMVKDYSELDFPQVRQDFSDTKIYQRKELEPSRL